jgi:hypothetical protein
MSISNHFTDAQLADIIARRRAGQSYPEIARAFSKQYGREVSEDSLRKLHNKYEHLFDVEQPVHNLKLLKDVARTKRSNSKVAKENRDILQALNNQDDLMAELESLVRTLNRRKPKTAKPKKAKEKRDMSMELMLSDLHIGKLSKTFNLEVARARLAKYTEVVLGEIERNAKSYNVEQLVVCLMGDLFENSLMHGAESLAGCEFQNPEQVRWVIELLFDEVFSPLAATGIPIHVICVAGNHGRQEVHKTYQLPGKNSLEWVCHHALRLLCAQAGFEMTWDIPEGVYAMYSYYGTPILFEHGDSMKGYSREAVTKHLAARSNQAGILFHGIRYGHVHTYSCVEEGKIISNASLCGQDSYSEVNGWNSTPGQVINFYVKTKNRPISFYHSFLVQL